MRLGIAIVSIYLVRLPSRTMQRKINVNVSQAYGPTCRSTRHVSMATLVLHSQATLQNRPKIVPHMTTSVFTYCRGDAMERTDEIPSTMTHDT